MAVDPDSVLPDDSSGAKAEAAAPSSLLFLAVTIGCFSPMLFGFSLGFTSPTQNVMEGNRVETSDGTKVAPPDYLIAMSEEQETMFAAVLNVGAVIGALSGASLSDQFGRRTTLALTAVPHMLAWVGMYFNDGWNLVALRLLLGLGVGVGCAVTPSYIAEVSTTSLRGSLGAANQLSVTIGIFFAAIAGKYFFEVPKHEVYFTQWRYMSLCGAGLAVVLAMNIFMPESPQWLAKRKGRKAAAESLAKLRKGDTTAELSEVMNAGADSDVSTGEDSLGTKLRDLCSQYRQSLVIGVGCQFFQQFSGINAVIFFLVRICESAGLPNPRMMAMYSMLFQVFMTAVAVALMEKAGRRLLLLTACGSMAIALFMLAYYYWAAAAADASGGAAPPAMIAVIALIIYIAGFSVGMGPIPWLILGELFPQEVAATASSIAVAVNWTCSFFVTLTFASLVKTLGAQGVFAAFGIIVAGAFVFVYTLLPETKGKTIDEVLAMLRGEGGGDGDVSSESSSEEEAS